MYGCELDLWIKYIWDIVESDYFIIIKSRIEEIKLLNIIRDEIGFGEMV